MIIYTIIIIIIIKIYNYTYITYIILILLYRAAHRDLIIIQSVWKHMKNQNKQTQTD